jgi:hypothetical protein
MKKGKIYIALMAVLIAGPAFAQLGGIGGGVGGSLGGAIGGGFGHGRDVGSTIGAGADSAFNGNARVQRDLERQSRAEKPVKPDAVKVEDTGLRKVESESFAAVGAGATASRDAVAGNANASQLDSVRTQSATGTELVKTLPSTPDSAGAKDQAGGLLASDRALSAAEGSAGSEKKAAAEGNGHLVTSATSHLTKETSTAELSKSSDKRKSPKTKADADGKADAAGKGHDSALTGKALGGEDALTSTLASAGKAEAHKAEKDKPAKGKPTGGKNASAAPARKQPSVSAKATANAQAKGSVQVAENRRSSAGTAQKSR